MKIRFEITPQPKQSAKFYSRGGKTMSYQPKEKIEYKNFLRFQAIAANQKEHFYTEKPIVVRNLIFSFPWLSNATKKDKAKGLIPRSTKPDTDNLEKSLWDALEGVFFKNDSQIVRKSDVVKIYGEKAGIYLELDEWDDNDTAQVLAVLNEFKGE